MKAFYRLLLCAFALCVPYMGFASEWRTWHDCTLVEGEYGDGDSFVVKLPNAASWTVRLYGVDAPEPDASIPGRVGDQAYVFQTDTASVVKGGLQATARTKELLKAGPFTVITKLQDALGRAGSRIYAWVFTSEQKDLGSQLVEEGLARAYGEMPDDSNRPVYKDNDKALDDLLKLQAAAQQRKNGLWGAVQSFQSPPVSHLKRNINEMTAAEIAAEVPKLGAETARNIVVMRGIVPEKQFKTWEQVDLATGVGEVRLKLLKKYLDMRTVSTKAPPADSKQPSTVKPAEKEEIRRAPPTKLGDYSSGIKESPPISTPALPEPEERQFKVTPPVTSFVPRFFSPAPPVLPAASVKPDINEISATDMANIVPGIGPTRAAAIIHYRNTVLKGKFNEWYEVGFVQGIGPVLLKALQEYLVLKPDPTRRVRRR